MHCIIFHTITNLTPFRNPTFTDALNKYLKKEADKLNYCP